MTAAIVRKRGNPNWGKWTPKEIWLKSHTETTEFEKQCQRLFLVTDQEILDSKEMRQWIRKNSYTKYVPERLLLALNITVNWEF